MSTLLIDIGITISEIIPNVSDSFTYFVNGNFMQCIVHTEVNLNEIKKYPGIKKLYSGFFQNSSLCYFTYIGWTDMSIDTYMSALWK